MVDPVNFTNFKLSNLELEEYVLFCIAVAGKNALTTAKNLDRLVSSFSPKTPFEAIRQMDLADLTSKLKSFGFGCYNLKAKGFHYIAHAGLNLKKCSCQQLERCPGIGQKTSRFFLLHTRKQANVACLDTHILRCLRDLGYAVPKSTPPGKQYLQIEKAFLELASQSGKSVADLDLSIWRAYSNHASDKAVDVLNELKHINLERYLNRE